eukprot:6180964-Pleurochrysis_carterae.AAC.1
MPLQPQPTPFILWSHLHLASRDVRVDPCRSPDPLNTPRRRHPLRVKPLLSLHPYPEHRLPLSDLSPLLRKIASSSRLKPSPPSTTR